MLKYIIYSLIVLSFWHADVLAQDKIDVKFTFDDCTYDASGTLILPITPGGNPQCVCGIGGKSILLNGTDDFLTMDKVVNRYFDTDFTFDFYFSMDNPSGEIDIMSLRSGCNRVDSLMQLRYLSSNNEILFEIGSNINNYNTIRAKLNTTNCWHRFTLVKFGLLYFVYLDNVLISKFVARENIIMTRLGSLSFGNSPCKSNTNAIQRFSGNIDQINIRNTATSELDLKDSFLFPDRIVTENTTIFKGESIQLITGPKCTNNISWSPAATLDDATAADPVATPEVTTTYEVTINNGNCISKDTVRIFVADKETSDCKTLLLPGAFTPNNDGLNDTYGISNTFIVDEVSYFEIYDRWGEKVWESDDLKGQWDGNKQGVPLNGGMYLYKIKYTCNNEEYLKIDNFMMLR